jgi:hypothetical protein
LVDVDWFYLAVGEYKDWLRGAAAGIKFQAVDFFGVGLSYKYCSIDLIEDIEIIRVENSAEKFNAIEAFRSFEGERDSKIAEAKAKSEAAQEKLAAGFDKTDSGLRYQIIQKGTGGKSVK